MPSELQQYRLAQLLPEDNQALFNVIPTVSYESEELWDLIVQLGTRYNATTTKIVMTPATQDDRTLLHIAVERQAWGVVDLIAKRWRSQWSKEQQAHHLSRWACFLNHRDSSGMTALNLAASVGDLVSIPMLLGEAKLGVKDNAGNVEIHNATISNTLDVLQFFFNTHPTVYRVDLRNTNKETCLHMAAKNGSDEIVRYLLGKGAKVNHRKKGDLTPLHVAASVGSTNTIAVLIEGGAHIASKTNRTTGGLTALHYVCGSGEQAAVEYLLRNGRAASIVNLTNREGASPLHVAVRNNRSDMVRCLMSYGADLRIRDKKGYTVRDLAIEKGFGDVLAALSERHIVPSS